jgi:hypothetical protein
MTDQQWKRPHQNDRINTSDRHAGMMDHTRGRQHRNHSPGRHDAAGQMDLSADERTEEVIMNDQKDQPVLNRIQSLVSEEHRLYGQGALADADRERLATINVELDQCWDLLRQRRALRETGGDPNQAHVRPPEIVEKYEQ